MLLAAAASRVRRRSGLLLRPLALVAVLSNFFQKPSILIDE
jgi:hypothetical protein